MSLIGFCLTSVALSNVVTGLATRALGPATAQVVQSSTGEVILTAEQDHPRLLHLLKITKLRPGANPRSTDPSAAPNCDEAKANPYSKLPDPLTLKNGNRVKDAKTWWKHRRPEIIEDFDREIYGPAPRNTPKVTWEVLSTTPEMKGDFSVITKKLVDHVGVSLAWQKRPGND